MSRISNPFTVQIVAGPAWFSSQSEKTWTTVANTADINAVYNNSGNDGEPAIMTPWGGGVVDTTRKALVVWGGGHGDYGGNEVYRLILNVASPAWVRYSANGSSNPPSQHSQRNLVYCSSTDTYWIPQIFARYPDGYPESTIWKMPANGTTGSAAWSYVGNSGDLFDNGNRGGFGFYDPVRDRMIGFTDAGARFEVNPQNNALTTLVNPPSPSPGFNYYLHPAYWPETRTVIIYRLTETGAAMNRQFRLYDCTNPTKNSPAYSDTITPANAPSSWGSTKSQSSIGFVWWPRGKCILAWSGHDTAQRSSIWKCTPSNPNATTYAQAAACTWTWSEVAAVGGSVPSLPAYGASSGYQTHGRFNLIESLSGNNDALVLVNGCNQPTYVYKLPASGVL